MMKFSKIISVICICFVMAISGIVVSSQSTAIPADAEIIFAEDSAFTAEQKQNIEAAMRGENFAPYGLKCLLFGHTYQTEYIAVIQHKISETSPRCMRETYEVSICEDCSDTISTRVGATFIICCE